MNHILNARLRGRTGLFTLRWLDGRISAIEAQADTLPPSDANPAGFDAVG